MYYTDGSKTGAGVGCAFITQDVEVAIRLPQYASVFTAELVAIHEAILHAVAHHHDSIVICTDSRSSIQALQAFNPTNHLVQTIQHLLFTSHYHITLCWTPSHISIVGNERADTLARGVITHDHIVPRSLPYQDGKTAIKFVLTSRWRNQWRALQGNKLRAVKDNTYPRPVCVNRLWDCTLTRIRIGHTRLTPYGWRSPPIL